MTKLIIKIPHSKTFCGTGKLVWPIVRSCGIIGFEEVEEKSSHYGLYMLGFTCATRVETKRRNGSH